jgi:hypothetical protein
MATWSVLRLVKRRISCLNLPKNVDGFKIYLRAVADQNRCELLVSNHMMQESVHVAIEKKMNSGVGLG